MVVVKLIDTESGTLMMHNELLSWYMRYKSVTIQLFRFEIVNF